MAETAVAAPFTVEPAAAAAILIADADAAFYRARSRGPGWKARYGSAAGSGPGRRTG